MLKNKLIYVPQKIFQQILPTKATNTPNYQLPINYYDPEGNLVGTYSGINLAANETITHHQLKRFINTHLPENYEVFPYFFIFYKIFRGNYSPSSTISIALKGQTLAHTPHPLQ